MTPLTPVDREAEPGLRGLLDAQAKPPGAMGRMEDLAVRLALIAGRADPVLESCRLLIFAGDHGLAGAGASRYPPEVTAAMVGAFLRGRAVANAFAAAVGAEVRVVDAGVDAELAAHPMLIDAKVRRGARNAAVEPALTVAEAEEALARGFVIGAEAADSADVVALGDMGIGNSAAAALVIHRLAPAPLDDCIGAGAGQDAEGMARKRALLHQAAGRTDTTDPTAVLAEFAGLEIAMMAGAALGAASRSRPVLVDGFIASAAALAAVRLDPALADYLVFAHRSSERGHRVLLEALGVEPLLDLSLRLGEGTGALLALPLLRAAVRLLTDVASLGEILGHG